MSRHSSASRGGRYVLITGGCGFIGCNLANALARRGERVVLLDSLAREGARQNAEWLQGAHGGRVATEIADVRDEAAVRALVREAAAVLHLAAQVAVTTSLTDPIEDFEINARGTLNVLDAIRRTNPDAPLLFASTNKVYGKLLEDDELVLQGTRYIPRAPALRRGADESKPLDLYSPYGCSKGAADQYVLDFARVFGLRTAVLRMSCIYGPRQFGTEDQGWIAHFILCALRGAPITLCGDGNQVRDALHIEDAVAAWLAVLDRIDAVQGRVFNLGGGPANAISLNELLGRIGAMLGRQPALEFVPRRPGDQAWYVSDTTALRETLGWKPCIALDEGLNSLTGWLRSLDAPHAAARLGVPA